MILSAGSTFIVEYGPAPAAGTSWTVRVFRKGFPFRKRISSDWFLGREQATLFAEKLAADLRNGAGIEQVRDRKPGWTLHRARR
jgi:hypothetical protein